MCEHMVASGYYKDIFTYKNSPNDGGRITPQNPNHIIFVNSVLNNVIHWEPSQRRSLDTLYHYGSNTI